MTKHFIKLHGQLYKHYETTKVRMVKSPAMLIQLPGTLAMGELLAVLTLASGG